MTCRGVVCMGATTISDVTKLYGAPCYHLLQFSLPGQQGWPVHENQTTGPYIDVLCHAKLSIANGKAGNATT